MHFSADNLMLVFGLAGFFALLGGCVVVAGYLVCSGLPGRTTAKPRRADMHAGINLFPW